MATTFWHDRTDTVTVPQLDKSVPRWSQPAQLHDGSYRTVTLVNNGPSTVYLHFAPNVSDTINSGTLANGATLVVGGDAFHAPIYAVVGNSAQPSTVTVRHVWRDQTNEPWGASLPLTDLSSGGGPSNAPTVKG